MLKYRVIPTLLLNNGGLVKTHKFKKPKYIGDPINAIKIFNEKEVDELIVLDIEASKEKKDPDYKLIEQFSSECFSPLCYGGGIKNIEQANILFSLGVEKISIQSAALNNLDFIKELSDRFGSQSIVFSLDIRKNWKGSYKIYSSAFGKTINENWLNIINKVTNSGAGELLINSVNRDGTLSGMEIELIKQASQIVDVPVIASGGAGNLEDIKLAVINGANAVAAGAFFVFNGPRRAVLITYPKYNELEILFKEIHAKE